jgi:hypothetical protein
MRLRLSATWLAAGALLVLALVPAAFGRATAGDTWAGTWSSEWGTMTVTQAGSRVEGTYPHDQGHIAGGASGDVFTGRWDEAPTRKGPGDAGQVILTLGKDGKSFTGKWNYDGSPTRWSTDWNGRCTGGACLQNGGGSGGGQPAKRICTTTYAVVPGGEEIAANVKLVELNAREKQIVLGKEEAKYDGFTYTPLGPVTRKQNCAGYVMARLFGSTMVEANVEPDGFYRKVVVPFGSKRISRLTARAGDVVVYRDAGGTVKHVALVESNRGGPTILTKDGDERLYRADFPLSPLRLANDPLVVNHAERGKGSVEFWRVDRSKVAVKQVSTDCPG